MDFAQNAFPAEDDMDPEGPETILAPISGNAECEGCAGCEECEECRDPRECKECEEQSNILPESFLWLHDPDIPQAASLQGDTRPAPPPSPQLKIPQLDQLAQNQKVEKKPPPPANNKKYGAFSRELIIGGAELLKRRKQSKSAMQRKITKLTNTVSTLTKELESTDTQREDAMDQIVAQESTLASSKKEIGRLRLLLDVILKNQSAAKQTSEQSQEAEMMTVESLQREADKLKDAQKTSEQEELEKLREQCEQGKYYECIICLERHRAIVFLPCAHFSVCTICCLQIDSCPRCRAPIEEYLKVHP